MQPSPDNDDSNNAKVLIPAIHTSSIRLTQGRSCPDREKNVRNRHVERPKVGFVFDVPPSFRERTSRAWMARTCTRALLVHVLYVRGIVPMSALEILRLHEELCTSSDNTSTMIPREHRSSFKCGTKLSQLLQEFDDVINSHYSGHIGAVLISLGPAWSRQREQYVIQVNGLGQDRASSKNLPVSVPSAQQEHTVSRRLVSAFMNATNSDTDQNLADFMAKPALGASSYQVHLSFWVSSRDAKQVFDASATNNNKWLSRHNFRVERQQSTARNSKKPALVQTRITVAEAPTEWNEGTGIWMTLPTTVKGFRLSR